MESTNTTTTTQPQAAIQMNVVNPAPGNAQNPQECNHVKRIRGGDGGDDCLGECLSSNFGMDWL
ncbi:hypothetical protein BDN67DRAFT_969465 [Paxillus ammoniavirescens]|nr:hypothetical protein BDN67DRAFT_969465 [Paxillus ammoniavirescens]